MDTSVSAPGASPTPPSTPCALCGHIATEFRYRGSIRAGSFGKLSAPQFAVLSCAQCGVQFLDPFPLFDYASDEYRESYENSSSVTDFFAIHDALQPRYVRLIAEEQPLRGQIVGDFGAGAGSFLDHVAGLARTTVAIEPFMGYHESLRARGHHTYPDTTQFLADLDRPQLDLAVSIHVIEHVPDPAGLLRDIRRSLRPGGIAYVCTPNNADVLMKLGSEEYAKFNYRTAHLWYFNASSLSWAARAAGFTEFEFRYQHNYDLSNALSWLAEGKPTGNGRIAFLDERINAAWRSYLEGNAMADTIWLVARAN